MQTSPTAQAFLELSKCWAEQQTDIQAVALVGSHARGSATAASDIDLVILTDHPDIYLTDTAWTSQFGTPSRLQVEDYGALTSLRVWYAQGLEVEFGLTTRSWAAQPLDSGTDRVLMDGIHVLFERSPVLSPALHGFAAAEEIYAELIRAFQARANPKVAARSRYWCKNADFQSFGLWTVDSRELFRGFRPQIQRLPLRGRLHLARLLVLTGFAEPADFANAVLARSIKELGPADLIYLDEHVNAFHGWGQTDGFCTGVLQPLLWKFPEEVLTCLRAWNTSDNLWKRRASVVAFVRKMGASGRFTATALELCENLLWDKEDLIQKGVGWALKDMLRGDKQRVLDYIKTLRRRGVPATITLYAIRDLKGVERQEILAIHRQP